MRNHGLTKSYPGLIASSEIVIGYALSKLTKWSDTGLKKLSALPVLDRFLKLKTDLFLNKKLSIKLYFSSFCNTQTDIVTCQNCSHLIICCYLS